MQPRTYYKISNHLDFFDRTLSNMPFNPQREISLMIFTFTYNNNNMKTYYQKYSSDSPLGIFTIQPNNFYKMIIIIKYLEYIL